MAGSSHGGDQLGSGARCSCWVSSFLLVDSCMQAEATVHPRAFSTGPVCVGTYTLPARRSLTAA